MGIELGFGSGLCSGFGCGLVGRTGPPVDWKSPWMNCAMTKRKKPKP